MVQLNGISLKIKTWFSTIYKFGVFTNKIHYIIINEVFLHQPNIKIELNSRKKF